MAQLVNVSRTFRKDLNPQSPTFGLRKVPPLLFNSIPNDHNIDGDLIHPHRMEYPYFPKIGANAYATEPNTIVYYADSPKRAYHQPTEDIYMSEMWHCSEYHNFIISNTCEKDPSSNKIINFINSLQIGTETDLVEGNIVYVDDDQIQTYGILSEIKKIDQKRQHSFQINENNNCTINPITISEDDQIFDNQQDASGGMQQFDISQSKVSHVLAWNSNDSFKCNYTRLKLKIKNQRVQELEAQAQLLDNMAWKVKQSLREGRNPNRRIYVAMQQ